MSIKKIGRSALLFAVTAAACALPALSGCTIKTDHPEATITITFDGTDYALKYKLYRNMYPQTVQHFIELADNGFYDNTIIHDYQTSYWYGGGYTYSTEDSDTASSYANSFSLKSMVNYLEYNSKELAYKTLAETTLTPSVYKSYYDNTYSEPLTTLIGEFSNNKHTITSGALTGGFGNLRMYYSDKDTDEVIYTKKDNNEDKEILAQYKYNSATSLFSIQVGTSTSSDSSHCIFGVLQDTDVLTDLQTAITDWRDASDYTSSTFTTSTTVNIDNYDAVIGSQVTTATYKLTAEPIIVKSVKITKY
jgi:cyclophilin family peptidyl-prolyl cis-trans isomerase